MKYSSKNLRSSLGKIKFGQTNIAKEQQRDGYTNHKERVLRVLSWLSAAEKYNKEDNCDYDVCLMCTLAAFNGLYAQHDKINQDHQLIDDMITHLIKLDTSHILLKYLQSQKKELDEILNNQYLFYGYWCSVSEDKTSDTSWQEEYNLDNERIRTCYPEGMDYAQKTNKKNMKMLSGIIRRIQALRHQLMHGLAGYEDHYNRSQVKVCASFFRPLVGRMLKIIIDNPDLKKWGYVPCPPQRAPDTPADNLILLESKKQSKKRK